jgi:hypothetical protein
LWQLAPDWGSGAEMGILKSEGAMKQAETTDVSPEFKATVDAVIATGHTCQSVLLRLDARLAKTPPGSCRDNLVKFRHELVEKIKNAGAF